MSILIKGMEMPKNCLECWNCDRNFRDDEGEPIKDWRCLLLFEHVGDSTNTRLNGCPLIELPDPVPIIRCKDCKWWDKVEGSPYGYCMAMKHGYMSANWEIGIYRRYKGDFYCADAERSKDEHTD